MKFSSVLIVTYGRSGSTLLQGLLNSIDGCLIRGENDNLCYNLYQSWLSIYNSQKFYAPSSKHPWFGGHLLNDRLFISQCKNILYSLILADRVHDPSIKCYGFKEIRYINTYINNDLYSYLRFLEQVFPNVAFIFNTRDHEHVSGSEWWAEMTKGEVVDILSDAEDKFHAYRKASPNNTFHIRYEDVVTKTTRLKELFHFLGVPYVEEKVNDVLGKPHSYKTVK